MKEKGKAPLCGTRPGVGEEEALDLEPGHQPALADSVKDIQISIG